MQVAVERIHGGALQQLLDANASPLNPRRLAPDGGRYSYSYGSLLLYLLKAAGAATGVFSPRLAAFEGIYLVGRAISAVADTVNVGAVFLVGRQLFGRRAGLLAAALSAFTVLQIQYAHYYVAEPLMVMFLMLALYFVLRTAGGASRAGWAAGACLGLAVGTKPSAAAFVPAALLIVAAGAARRTTARTAVGSVLLKGRSVLTSLGTVAGALVLTWVLTEPYALLDPQTYLANIRTESNIQRGLLDYPYTRQYVGTVPGWYHWQQYVRWAAGIPLGVTATVAVVSALWIVIARRRTTYLTLLVWCLPYAASVLFLEAKWLRYLLPVMPVLTVLAADLLVRAAGALALPRVLPGRLRPVLRWLPAAAVLAGTALWAAAFTRVYATEHPWITASRWMQRNVPPTAAVAVEHWDRQLPVDVRGSTSPVYPTVSANLYDDLPPDEKLAQISGVLRQSDYIFIASQRLYGSIPRSPWRYAVATRYYELLLQQRLGFVKVAEFASAPTLGTLPVNEGGADESFSVYDHPPVLVFRKARDLAPWELSALFADALQQPWTTARRAPAEKTLLLPWNAGTAQTGLPYFAGSAATSLSALLLWLLSVQLLGAAAWLLLAPWLASLPDRGWIAAKLLGWLMLSWLSWYSAALGLLPAGAGQVRAFAALLGLTAAVLRLRRRRQLPGVGRRALTVAAGFELLFLVLFFAGALLRAANPDLWQPYYGGEKPMELAFINGVLRSSTIPPYDPWFSGGYINYYYFGQFLAATLMRLSSVGPAFGFNLAVATVFALTGSLAACVGYTLAASRGKRATIPTAALSVLLLLLLGNADGAVQAWQAVRDGRLAQLGTTFDFWRSTRLVPGAINEFPYFTFLYGDLHAHLIAMPMDIALLLLAAALVLHRPRLNRALGLLLLGALLLASVAMTNPWDLPVFGGILSLCVLLWSRSRGALLSAVRFAVAGVALGGTVVLLSMPFFRSFKSFYSSVGLVKDPTPLPILLNVLGPFLPILVGFLFLRGAALTARPAAAGAAATILLVALAVGKASLGLLLVLLVMSLWTLWRARGSYVWPWLALGTAGLAVWVGIELLYLKDFLAGGDAYRMNTVFKFGLQSWVLLALGCAGLAHTWISSTTGRRRALPAVLLVLALSIGLVYPVYGTGQRLRQRFPVPPPGLTLDGEAYMRTATLANETGRVEQLRYDYDAILWLRRSVPRPETLVEASIGPYRGNGSRVSSFTGLPAVVGWDNHESQQRYADQVFTRSRDVRTLYDTPSEQQALTLIEKYGIRYIYVGPVERLHQFAAPPGGVPEQYASPAGLAKFGAMVGRELDVAYSNPGVTIYRVRPSWQWPAPQPDGGAGSG